MSTTQKSRLTLMARLTAAAFINCGRAPITVRIVAFIIVDAVASQASVVVERSAGDLQRIVPAFDELAAAQPKRVQILSCLEDMSHNIDDIYWTSANYWQFSAEGGI